MGGAASKRKGSKAEREIAELISNWWRSIEPDCIVKRTPGSGGWSHASAFKSKGDLVVTRESGPSAFPFFVEVKRFEAFSERNLRTGKDSPIWHHWTKATIQACDEGKWPLLFVRKSRSPWFVVGPDWVFLRTRTPILLRRIVTPWFATLAEAPHLFLRDPHLLLPIPALD